MGKFNLVANSDILRRLKFKGRWALSRRAAQGEERKDGLEKFKPEVGRGASSTGVAVSGRQITGISRAAAEAGTAGGWGQEGRQL